jgi:hypothetical protein
MFYVAEKPRSKIKEASMLPYTKMLLNTTGSLTPQYKIRTEPTNLTHVHTVVSVHRGRETDLNKGLTVTSVNDLLQLITLLAQQGSLPKEEAAFLTEEAKQMEE